MATRSARAVRAGELGPRELGRPMEKVRLQEGYR